MSSDSVLEHATRGSPSTSAQVTLTATLDTPCAVSSLQAVHCTFAGGFAPIRVVILAGIASEANPKEVAWIELATVYPADGNLAQTFPLKREDVASQLQAAAYAADVACTHLVLRLEGSTDGFGRLVVYRLAITV
ncbi:hypothetical protein MBRA1_003265 [Malassezia brasiliensis]|uniref:Uncharacterized protein n=1 Tax=Malassezia brasiliensis TaxID=1821822 RepID=A0AAF0DVL9_9BASI|nr:hypothetical protein MBRA1_003265 [Malassezia brasiliensis]